VTDRVSRGYWQVLEVRPELEPGLFTLFVLPSPTDMLRVPLRVPRRFLINRSTPWEGAPDFAQRLKEQWHLPRGRRQGHLYEVSMPERHFRRNRRFLAAAQSDPMVEGVYESKTPLMLRALAGVGCVTRLAPSGGGIRGGGPAGGSSRKNRGSGRKYTAGDEVDLEQLEWVTTADHDYMSVQSAVYRRAFVFHATSRAAEESDAEAEGTGGLVARTVLAVVRLEQSNRQVFEWSV